jgi:hypothetical protein
MCSETEKQKISKAKQTVEILFSDFSVACRLYCCQGRDDDYKEQNTDDPACGEA